MKEEKKRIQSGREPETQHPFAEEVDDHSTSSPKIILDPTRRRKVFVQTFSEGFALPLGFFFFATCAGWFMFRGGWVGGGGGDLQDEFRSLPRRMRRESKPGCYSELLK